MVEVSARCAGAFICQNKAFRQSRFDQNDESPRSAAGHVETEVDCCKLAEERSETVAQDRPTASSFWGAIADFSARAGRRPYGSDETARPGFQERVAVNSRHPRREAAARPAPSAASIRLATRLAGMGTLEESTAR